MTRQFEVGQRVYVYEFGFEAKIVRKQPKEKNGRTYFLVREYEHPHTLVWVDDYHISEPLTKRHDEKWLARLVQKVRDHA